MIEINRNPTPAQLRWTGALLALFFLLLGGMIWWQFGNRTAAITLWALGGVAAVSFYALPPLRRPIYLGWMYLAFPIGWAVSHILLAAIFYLVVTPIGLIMRLVGRDPLDRRLDHTAQSYWIKRGPHASSERYFRQF